jgi:hypothetical protein
MPVSAFVKSVDAAGGSPNISVTVDANDAIAAIHRLSEKQIPEFLKQYISQVALEARKVMVQFSSSPYIQRRTGRLATSIDIFEIPGGVMVGPSVYYAKWVFGGHEVKHAGQTVGYALGRPAHEWTAETVRDRAPTIALALASRMLGGEE